MRAGTLYLTVQDAIALALENNIDLDVSRYNPLAASWQVERAEAGGAFTGRTQHGFASLQRSQRAGSPR